MRPGIHVRIRRGVPQDDAEAMKWYRKAAEQGDVQAYKWLALSKARSTPGSANYKTTSKRMDFLATLMTLP